VTWWLRVRRWPAALGCAVFSALLVGAAGGHGIALPTLLGGGLVPVPAAFIVPLVAVIGLAYALENGDHRLTAVSVRPVRALDTLYAAVLTGVVLAGCAVCALTSSPETGLAGARNTIGYAALCLGVRAWAPTVAAVVPAGWAVAASALGRDGEHVAFWAWPVAPATDAASWVWVVVALMAAVLLNSGRSSRIRAAH
jgi:hypothetical protein